VGRQLPSFQRNVLPPFTTKHITWRHFGPLTYLPNYTVPHLGRQYFEIYSVPNFINQEKAFCLNAGNYICSELGQKYPIQQVTLIEFVHSFPVYAQKKKSYIVFTSIEFTLSLHTNCIVFTFFIISFYVQSVPVHLANCVATYIMARRIVFSSAPL
jgi:hypothetical protein